MEESRATDRLINQSEEESSVEDEVEVTESGKGVSLRTRVLLGVVCLLVIVVTWVVQAQLLHAVGDPSPTAPVWNKPYLLSYIIHAAFALWLPLGYLLYHLRRRSLPPLPWRRLLLYGAIMGPGITLGGCAWYISLQRTSVSINTSVYNANFVFVFVLSIFLIRETVSIMRVNGTILCLLGLFFIMGSSLLSLGAHQENSFLGYLFLLLSMLMYAFLSVFWVRVIPSEVADAFAHTPVLGFMGIGMVGVFSMVLMWIGVIIGHFSGLEPFELPYGTGLQTMLISMFMDLILNAALLVGSLLMSPVFIAVGSLLTIPVGILVELIFSGTHPSPIQGIGVFLVLIGSLTFELGEPLFKKLEGKCGKKLYGF